MRISLIGLLMTALVFGFSANMALGAEPDGYLGSGQTLPGPAFVAQHHASTVEEGVLRGTGALLRGAGEAEYLRSLALINREHARRLYIENRQQAAETYFNLKRINRYAREELRAPRATAQDLARYAKERLPAVLSDQVYDRENGVVTWPIVLLRKEFASDRELIDALAVQRSNVNVLVPEVASEIASATDAMLGTLRANGTNLNSTDYITAMKFIKSLNYDARMNPTQVAPPTQAVAGTPSLDAVVSR